MDIDAVSNCTHDDLRALGLQALGDILAIKHYAKEISSRGQTANQKRLLLESFLNSSSPNKKPKSQAKSLGLLKPSSTVTRTEKTRKVLLGKCKPLLIPSD